jgi:hypothetical protein
MEYNCHSNTSEFGQNIQTNLAYPVLPLTHHKGRLLESGHTEKPKEGVAIAATAGSKQQGSALEHEFQYLEPKELAFQCQHGNCTTIG